MLVHLRRSLVTKMAGMRGRETVTVVVGFADEAGVLDSSFSVALEVGTLADCFVVKGGSVRILNKDATQSLRTNGLVKVPVKEFANILFKKAQLKCCQLTTFSVCFKLGAIVRTV